MGAVVCSWIMGVVSGLVGVSGCRVQAGRLVRMHGGSSRAAGCVAGCVAGCIAGCVGVIAVCVSQTALDGELQHFFITQVTVERVILEAQTGSC